MNSKSIIDGLPKRYEDKGFQGFKDLSESLKKKKAICWEFSQSKLTEKSLVMFGNVGTGKTHLAVAIAKNIPQKQGLNGYEKSRVKFIVADELFAKFNDLAFEKKSKMQFINELILSDLIIIDDLGIANFTPAKQENLYLLINRIYLDERRLVLTTNFSLEELEKHDPRITSRLAEMGKILMFDNEDYRIR